MPLQKQNLALPFAVTLDTKTDPFQLTPGSMLSVVNAVYTNDKKISKRNGFMPIASLPSNANATLLTTFNSNLTAVGNNFYAYNSESVQWLNKGLYQPVNLSVIPVVRSSTQQDQLDCAVSPQGLACMVFRDAGSRFKYQVFDSITSQIFVNPVNLPTTAHLPRVFILDTHFIITYLDNAIGNALYYIAIPIANPSSPLPTAEVSSNVLNVTHGYDGCVQGTNLYLAWAGNDGLRYTYFDSHFNQYATLVTTGEVPVNISVYANPTFMWISYYDSSNNVKTLTIAIPLLATWNGPVTIENIAGVTKITSASVIDNTIELAYGISNTYGYNSDPTNYVRGATCNSGGTIAGPNVIIRSVDIASKAFTTNGKVYALAAFESSYQSTYFLIDSRGNVVMKLAYENGGGYTSSYVLPGANINSTGVQIAYQYKDLIQAANGGNNTIPSLNIYTQTGANLATINLASGNIVAAEIGHNLHLTGGFLWMYDGSQSCEHSFFVWPEDILATPSTSGGSMTNQDYFYQVTYEWTDAQGNIHRSAPSIAVHANIASGGSGSVTLNIPTLRLTYKNNVRIVIYRWSTAQQEYYQITSITSPTLNNPTVDSITYVDTQADSAILGNALIYTTGGVVENIQAPACNTLCLYKSRLMVLSAEDPNVVWYSKQVVEAVPVETSDLFTIYAAPSIGVQGSTGPTTALAALDDKFILYKEDAIYYLTGQGPDNTGANDDFSDPVFVTATVGCANQRSVSFIPSGLMSQSNKGIWLLGRDLSTSYIGANVESSNSATVTSTVNPPGSNQIRLCLDNGTALMYDYFYGRWGYFENIPSLSSTIFQGLHTYLLKDMSVRQETPGAYFDNGRPVLMSFTTSWFNFAGLQGYERLYFIYILGQFLSPNKLQVNIAYDYNPSPTQSTTIEANNYSLAYGLDPLFGDGSPYGGPSVIEQWRIFAQRQRCQAFQITVNELFDSIAPTEGAGLSFSGLNLVYGLKKAYHPQPASTSAG